MLPSILHLDHICPDVRHISMAVSLHPTSGPAGGRLQQRLLRPHLRLRLRLGLLRQEERPPLAPRVRLHGVRGEAAGRQHRHVLGGDQHAGIHQQVRLSRKKMISENNTRFAWLGR